MTRQEFISGKEFTIGTGIFVFEVETREFHKPKNVVMGSIVKREYYKGKLSFTTHEGNVENVGSKFASCYTLFLGDIIKKKLKLEDLM